MVTPSPEPICALDFYAKSKYYSYSGATYLEKAEDDQAKHAGKLTFYNIASDNGSTQCLQLRIRPPLRIREFEFLANFIN